MEIENAGLGSVIGSPETMPLLKPGDQIAVRVLKRIAPFRYLVSYRGYNFQVNSSLLLKLRDLVLLYLVKLHPRLQFKFVARLAEQPHPGSFNLPFTVPGFDDDPLSRQYVEWSLRFNLPLNQEIIKQLKIIFSGKISARADAENSLLPYFWIKMHFDVNLFHDPLFLLRLVQNEDHFKTQIARLKNRLPLSKDAIASAEQKFLGKLLSFFENEFVPAQLFESHLELLKDLHEFIQYIDQTGSGKSIHKKFFGELKFTSPDSPFIEDVIHYFFIEFEGYKTGRWVLLPFPGKNGKGNIITFWRRNNRESKILHEFVFNWNSDYFGGVNVKGQILEKNVDLDFYNIDQEFRNIVDNYIPELRERFYSIGLNLAGYHFKSEDLFQNFLINTIYCMRDSKFEVVI